MHPSVRVVVSQSRRRRVLTVRWSVEYLLGRFIALLSLTHEPSTKGQLFDAALLLEDPGELVSRLKQASIPYDPLIFPPYVLDTLSDPIPRTTPRYEDGLGLGVSKGLINVEKRVYGPVFSLTAAGYALAQALLKLNTEDAARAELAALMTRTSD